MTWKMLKIHIMFAPQVMDRRFFPLTVGKLKFSLLTLEFIAAAGLPVWCWQIEQEIFSRACHHHHHDHFLLLNQFRTWCKSINFAWSRVCCCAPSNYVLMIIAALRSSRDTHRSRWRCAHFVSHKISLLSSFGNDDSPLLFTRVKLEVVNCIIVRF